MSHLRGIEFRGNDRVRTTQMNRNDRANALMRLKINNAKKTNTFINRNVVFVMYEDGQERNVHLPYMKYFKFLSQQ